MVKVIKNKERLKKKKSHSKEEPRETQQLNVVGYHEWDPGAENWH